MEEGNREVRGTRGEMRDERERGSVDGLEGGEVR